MGKPLAKKSKSIGSKQTKPSDRNSKAFDEDTAVFITMSQELKEEGNKLFQKRDHEGAMLKYEKALNLLPRNHIDVASLRSNMATCYMQMGIGQYPRAISECNLALEVAPKYSKALLKRARCYEALNRLDLALRDVNHVLSIEPNNLNALEISESVKNAIEKKGVEFDDKEIVLVPEYVDPSAKKLSWKIAKDKVKKKKNNKQVGLKKNEEKVVVEEKNEEEKVVVEVKKSVRKEKAVTSAVKLVFGEDIRCAQLPFNCDIKLLRDVVKDRFSNLKGVLVKYKDQEGDLITITTNDELRFAEKSGEHKGSLRFYIVDVSPEKDPLYELNDDNEVAASEYSGGQGKNLGNGDLKNTKCSVDDWIIQFARLFKNHVGFDSDSYLDLHELGMKLYSEAMEDTITGEDSQQLFEIAAEKFQEMAALALFNWGNVHMSRARKRVFFTEDGSREALLEQVKNAYEWAEREYSKAGLRYSEAIKIKSNFYEGLVALGQQQFEQAKLAWYYAIGNELDLANEILDLYNKAEDSTERGMQMWEEMEEQRLNGLLKVDKYKADLQKFGLDGFIKDVTAEEASEQASNMKSQIYLLWGTLLYERSIVEFKLGLPTWEECLEVAAAKFEFAGATPTDIAVMIKNHCSNDSAVDGLGFKIDEIVQAWNEMYDVKRWQTGVPSFRLEPLLRRRVPELHSMLENF